MFLPKALKWIQESALGSVGFGRSRNVIRTFNTLAGLLAMGAVVFVVLTFWVLSVFVPGRPFLTYRDRKLAIASVTVARFRHKQLAVARLVAFGMPPAPVPAPELPIPPIRSGPLPGEILSEPLRYNRPGF